MSDRCLHELVEEQVGRTPGAVAVSIEGESLTYRDLDRRASRVASRLRELGVGPESVVAVLLERSLELPVALLGVLKSGAAYLPLDPDLPAERLRWMLEDAGAAALLTESRLGGRLEAAADVVQLDDEERWGAGGSRRSGGAARPANLAYVIYTSGSTGRPKGVMVPHQGIVNRLLWMHREYGLEAGEGVLHKTTVGFDVSLWELFWPLIAGARMVMARPGGHVDARYLWDLVRRERVTTVHFVPTMLRVFLDERPQGAGPGPRRVFCSGEALPRDLEERCLVELGPALHNLYGPTEASVDVTHHRCQGGGTVVPIGTPIANTSAYVATGEGSLAPEGVLGELSVGGVALARGYRGRPDLTAERFVPDPFGATPGARLYRTGDLARWRDGRLEYAGRVDRQVKLRGQRIEPGEIEAALRRQPGVADAVVRAGQVDGETTLVAYVEAGILWRRVADVRDALRRELPDFMVPRAWVVLDELPVTPSGKVDWAALPEPGADELQQEYVAPRDELEERVVRIWEEVFALERVGVEDDFYDLGGHSLLAAQIATRLAALAQVPVTVAQVLNCPTVTQLAAGVRVWTAPGAAEATRAGEAGGGREPDRIEREGVRALESVRALADAVAGPAAADVDRRARFPSEAIDALRRERLLAAAVPVHLGGLGCPPTELAAMAHALGERCGATAMVWAMHQIQAACLARHGGEATHRWLAEMCERQLLVASVTSEAGVGGDIRTSVAAVEPDGEELRLVKDATTISYGDQADAFLVTARRSPDAAGADQALVLVTREEASLERRGGWDTMGMRGTCSPAYRLTARFGPDRVLPAPFSDIAAVTMVPCAHLLWSACWLGISADAVRRARDYLRSRNRAAGGARTLAEARLADAATRLQAARAMLDDVAGEYERALGAGRDGEQRVGSVAFAVRINGVKVFCSETAVDVVMRTLQVCGIAGYSETSPFSVARHLRDVLSAPLMVANDRVSVTTGGLQLLQTEV